MQLQERLMTDNNENGQARFGGNWTVVTRAETGKKNWAKATRTSYSFFPILATHAVSTLTNYSALRELILLFLFMLSLLLEVSQCRQNLISFFKQFFLNDVERHAEKLSAGPR